MNEESQSTIRYYPLNEGDFPWLSAVAQMMRRINEEQGIKKPDNYQHFLDYAERWSAAADNIAKQMKDAGISTGVTSPEV